jgi:nucleoside-diphosphate-sugar epimerase
VSTAVVTGGAGFLGSHLCEYLLHAAGAREQAADGVRRWLSDAELLLRGRPHQRPLPARDERGAPALNIGNPNEFTLLELADTVVRISGSSSEIIFEALPIDEPQVRQPDITRARQVLGWEPSIELEEGLNRLLDSLRAPVTFPT